jgi:transcription elongation factor Elf1
MNRPDQCPFCGSLNYIALNADGSRYNPFLDQAEQVRLHGQPLWSTCKCDECGATWAFRIVEIVEEKSCM